MKKRIGILYSGQLRGSSINKYFKKDNIILDSTTNFLLNDEFKKMFDFDVFFSVDDCLDIDKAKDYFGENLKNIHITETDWYMHPIQNKIHNFSYYFDNYSNIDFQNYENHIHAIYQYYRMYCCYNMLKNYEKENNIKYDYLIRIRPDIRLMQNVMPIFHLLESTNKQVFIEHEQLCIMKYELQDIFKLIETYGKYNKSIHCKESIYYYITAGEQLATDNIMRFCPEKQFIDHIYYTLKYKNYDFFETFIGTKYPSFNLLYRENGTYGYIPDSHPIYHDPSFIWVPIHSEKYILETFYNDLQKYKSNYPIVDNE